MKTRLHCQLIDATAAVSPVRRQDGAISIMYALLLIPLLGMCGLAVDAGLVYNRTVEMRNLADAIALSAAQKLNGTPAGVTNALTAAESIVTSFRYRNDSTSVRWVAGAVKFGTSADRNGAWMDGASAADSAGKVFYVKVDTSVFTEASLLKPVLMPVLSQAFSQVTVSTVSVAGRTSIDVAPLAICAMSPVAGDARKNSSTAVELVEYGFRRGVSYDLMQLNPLGTTPLNFVVNPVAMPGSAGSADSLLPAAIKPYMCAGTLALPRVTGDPVSVTSPFPLTDLKDQLNSRFDQYTGKACDPFGAPPDLNIKQYAYKLFPAYLKWMSTPTSQRAKETKVNSKLETVADLTPTQIVSQGVLAADFGPLWIYSKAVKYADYKAGVSEPEAGYARFDTSDWPVLYGTQTANKYPNPTSTSTAGTPYLNGTGSYFVYPTHAPAFLDRRVLNVPLLSCSSAPSGTATVLAIGRFFMTVEASKDEIMAEFAGILPPERINASVGLFP